MVKEVRLVIQELLDLQGLLEHLGLRVLMVKEVGQVMQDLLDLKDPKDL
jgi:hypothetical protein